MDCAEARDLLRREAGALPPGAAAHLAACPACAELAADGGRLARALGTGATPAPAAPGLDFDAMTSLLAAERSAGARLSSLRTPARLALAAAAVVLVAVAVAILRPRPDLDLYPGARLAVELAILLALSLAAAALALNPLHRRALPGALALALGLALAVPFALAAATAAHTGHAASTAGTGPDLLPRALACFGSGIVLGLPVLLAVRLLDRGEQRGLSRALSAGAAAGVAAEIALALHCPVTLPPHLLAGHAPLAAAFAAGAAAAWLARGVPREARKH